MTIPRPRATGFYATFGGREYRATVNGGNVVLRSLRGEPNVEGFEPSRIPTVQAIKTIARAEVDNLVYVRTVCQWHGEPFLVVGVDATALYVFYTGSRGEWIVTQPGMVRTGKLETHGRLERTQVTEIYEFVDPMS